MTSSDASGQPISLSDRLVWGLVAAAAFLFALTCWNLDGHPYPWQDNNRIFSAIITFVEMAVILFAIVVSNGPLAAMARLPLWAKIALAALVVIAFVTATIVAPDSKTSLVRTYAWFIHMLFGFSLWRLMGDRWHGLRPIVWPSIVVGVTLYIFVLAAYVTLLPDDRPFDWRRFWLGVSHIRQTGFYSVVGAASAIGLAAIARDTRRYVLAVIGASVCLALSYWSGTRGSLVAVLAAFIAGLVLLPALRNVRAIVALLIANVLGALISLVNQPPSPIYGIFRISKSAAVSGADEMASGRLTMWAMSARAVLDRPLFGWGDSQYRYAVPFWKEYNHPHNVLIQVGISWGLVGLVCFVALGLLLAWRFVTSTRSGGEEIAPAFLVAGGLATMALYEGTFYHPYPVMMTIVAVSFVLSARTRVSPAPAAQPQLET